VSVFTGKCILIKTERHNMLFLTPNQRCQSTEGSGKASDMTDIFVEVKGEQCSAVRIVEWNQSVWRVWMADQDSQTRGSTDVQ